MGLLWIGIAIVVIIVIIIANFRSFNSENKDDYKDGGGTQIGGSEEIPFFTPKNERAGMFGEKATNYHLRSLLKQDEYLLSNLLLPLKNGHFTEIDCVLVTRKGIFCIETKNWVGHVSGSDDDEYWIQKYDDPYKSDRKHKNPVKQNEGHCAVLERFLKNRFVVNNVVIFVDIEDGSGIRSYYAYTVSGFKNWYRSLDKLNITDDEIEKVVHLLKKNVATPQQLKLHREDVKRRFNN